MNTYNGRFTETLRPSRAGTELATAGSAGPITLAVPPALPSPGHSFVLRDVVATAFLRWRLVLLCLLIPVIASVAFALRNPVQHTSEGLLVVSINRESAGNADIGGYGPTVISVDVPKAVQSEIEIITSGEVIQAALQSMGPGVLYPEVSRGRLFGLLPPLPPDMQAERAAELMKRDLRADVVANTNIVRVQFSYPDRRLALDGLRALLAAYFKRRQTIFTDTAPQLLSTEVNRYAEELRTLEAEMTQVKSANGILDTEQSVRLSAGRLDSILQREDRVREQREAALAQLASACASLQSQPSKVFASSEVTNQMPNDDSRNTLLRLQQERAHVAAQYRPDYPAVVELDQKIAAAQATIRQNQRANFFTTREARNPTVELLQSRIAQAQVEADALDKQLGEITRQRDEAQRTNDRLLRAEAQLRDLGRRRDALDAVYRQFATREAGARLNSEARQSRGAAVHLVQQPTAPVSGRDMTPSFIAAGVVVGLLFCAAAAVLLTWLRRVFVTPDEAERSLVLPALASFPRVGHPFNTEHASDEVSDLAALLLDMGMSGRTRLIQFVSTDPDDQRGLLARAVAVELARAHGRSVLLADLDTDGKAHLADLGAQPLQVEHSGENLLAYGTVIPKLWVAYRAEDSALANPHASQQQVETVLGQLRQEFDTVLLVGPERLDTYAQRRLAVLVDANVVVVRGEQTEAPQARHLRDTILGSGGTLMGMVFTGQRQVVPRIVEHVI